MDIKNIQKRTRENARRDFKSLENGGAEDNEPGRVILAD